MTERVHFIIKCSCSPRIYDLWFMTHDTLIIFIHNYDDDDDDDDDFDNDDHDDGDDDNGDSFNDVFVR